MRPRFSIAAAGVICALVVWVLVAYPWFERVECLRSGPWSELKTLTSIGRIGIFIPYMVMPVALFSIWWKVRDIVASGLLVRYGSFIVTCGTTHLLGFILLFSPYYWIAAKLEIVTAAISMAVMVETIARKGQILDLIGSGAALAREAKAASEAKVHAEEQAEEAQRARADLAKANQALAEMNARLDMERSAEASRAEKAEVRSLDLEQAIRRIRAQDEALRTLEAPILEALDGVLVSVLVGSLTSERAADWTQRLVAHAHRTQARVVVLDVTGLSIIDTAVADTILKTVRALRILGSECMMTGVRPEVAQTIVGLGVDLQGLSTLTTLRQGLELAGRRR